MPDKLKSTEDKKKVKKSTTSKTSTVKKKPAVDSVAEIVPKTLEPTSKKVEESKPSIMNSRPYLASTTSALSARAAAAGADNSRMNGTGAGVLAAARAAVNSGRSTSQMSPTPILTRPVEPEPEPVKSTSAPVAPAQVESKGVEPVRFSVKRGIEPGTGHSDSNIRKILIYVGVVILVGAGLIFAIERFIQSQANNNPNQNQDNGNQNEPEYQFITIGTTVLADSTAGTITPNADYDTADVSLGSSRNDSSEAKVAKINHQIYQTFSRTTFEMENVDAGLPEVGVSLSDTKRIVTIDFGEVQVESEMMQKVSIANSNLKSITGTKTGDLVKFELELTSAGQFAARIDEDNNLVIEVKTDSQLATPDPEPTDPEPTDPEPTDPEPTDPEPPTDVNYNNPKSQNKQYVVSDVTGSKLISETYFYRDDVSSFLFSWGIRGTGENFIPNASAEYVTVDGKNYIEVKVSNLKYDQLHSTGKEKATITVSLGGTPLKNVFTREFKNGTATFRAHVSKKVDFKLHSTLTYDGYQLLTLQVFDK